MEIDRSALKNFYEKDAEKQMKKKFVNYQPNVDKMYDFLPLFDKYRVLNRQRQIVSLISEEEIENKKILEMGCGEGYVSLKLASAGADVVGLDLAKNKVMMAQKMKNASKNSKVSFVIGDAERPPFKPDFADFILMFETIEHLPNPGKCLQSISQLLAKNGKLYLSIPNALLVHFKRKIGISTESFCKDPRSQEFNAHLHYFSRKSFTEVLGDHGFRVTKVRGVLFEFPRIISPILLKSDKVISIMNRISRNISIINATTLFVSTTKLNSHTMLE